MAALLGLKYANLSKSGKPCRYATLQHDRFSFGAAAALDSGLKIVLESVSVSNPLINYGKD